MLQQESGHRRYSFAELKRATWNFSEVIGRGGSGIVYRGRLPNNRVATLKRLEGGLQGEAEFLAEVSTIGRINHLNLIQIWGFCAERKHKLLVFRYIEHGSLTENLSSNSLDWEKQFEIAVGTAKGLAYLHEECLEWVLHCDVKPQNRLLETTSLRWPMLVFLRCKTEVVLITPASRGSEVPEDTWLPNGS